MPACSLYKKSVYFSLNQQYNIDVLIIKIRSEVMKNFNDNILGKVKRIHFVGIGGSGMAPLAEILHHNGYILTGSDVNEGDTLDRIKALGIPVFMGHKAENIG